MFSVKNSVLVIWDLLLFSMLAFPRILQSVKLILLFLIVIFMLLNKTTIQMTRHYSGFIFLWIAYHLYISIVGVAYDNDFNSILANVRSSVLLFCVLFIVTNVIAQQEECLTHTIKTTVYAGLYIGLYNIVIMALAYTGRSVPFLFKLDATAKVGIHVGYSHIVSTNLSMLILVFPFLLFLLSWDRVEVLADKKLIKYTVWFSGIAMGLSGRRILWLIMGLSLFVYFLWTSKNLIKTGRNLLTIVVLILGGYLILSNSNVFALNSLFSRFQSAFIRDDSIGGEATRFVQVNMLTRRFLERPILGFGSAAKASYFRNGVFLTTSSFEMSYNAILFNGGIVGAIMYFGSLIELGKYIALSKEVNKYLSFAALGAYLFCVLANATNPYFGSSFDFLIMLFLPLMVADNLIKTEVFLLE